MLFWDRFSFLCSEKNKKPNTVCKELGLSTATATHWKNGTIPKGDVLVSVAQYFSCSVDYLLGRERDQRMLTDNEKLIIELFQDLSPTQQGELIGRAKMMVDQNEALYKQEGAG